MSSDLSEEIAAAAARLVVDEGLEYPSAKRKAARDLGRRGGRQGELPSNEQVEDAVREYIAIFCADTQPDELRALRQLALRWMERMAPFRPHLGGAVWRGTATRLSNIVIDLYCDDPKSAEIAFLNEGLDFDSGSDDPDTVILSTVDRSRDLSEPVTLHFVVHDHDDLRGALRPDSRGQSWRGDAQALRQRLQEDRP
ncbi:hypothetical protein F7Q92_00650 [Ideonella dechloratans]|uniref:Uncharacterized protein n=1 Tax=Ideonella dechloratans TaxID=36863 RepID=A0A643FKH5_IDEDE|nr:hypothetical protein [Ideonella dechloratans]KAB0585435.1 hypothetical protein F7Q92_00650 [Ideonella dechloratans]UFU09384.1 hypothetical protein LRM40_13880 [Ideonella dechloratans]